MIRGRNYLPPMIVFERKSRLCSIAFTVQRETKIILKRRGRWHIRSEVLRVPSDIFRTILRFSNSGNVLAVYLCVNPQNRVLYGDIQISLIPKIYGFWGIQDAKILNMHWQCSWSWFLRLGHCSIVIVLREGEYSNNVDNFNYSWQYRDLGTIRMLTSW